MAPFDKPYTTLYWLAIVSIALCCTILELCDDNRDLEIWVSVTQGHSNWYHLKALVQFIIHLS